VPERLMYFGRPDRPFHTSFARLAILAEQGCSKTREDVPRNQCAHVEAASKK
jgi:hypothetical protein